MQGNVLEWCYDPILPYPSDSTDAATDAPNTDPVSDTESHVLRGGQCINPTSDIRSAGRNNYQPTDRPELNGFRPARTYHVSPSV